ncbi:MAG TPA: HU family DNA-binding protein [Bacillota bacterium]|nr:HU family DNA-binding protein [Bacillota bacterium]HOA34900.1 HU family DNA-binding protein [Bacillota bacterium]HOJ84186.1 HU family DNA-binding protein [Bacillota bacterium]HOL14610.1 HU family DNA-binding protein [Bacillota bacterium]HPZ10760.1 HU family DNA-binding protein [Bacillota bacterium]
MNKSELIGLVSEKTEMAKKDVEKVVNTVIDSIVDAVAKDEKVQLVGFGTFEKRHRAARKGRNPATNEEITIPALNVPVFKAGKAFKDRVK